MVAPMDPQFEPARAPSARSAWSEILKPLAADLLAGAPELSTAVVGEIRERFPELFPTDDDFEENRASTEANIALFAELVADGREPQRGRAASRSRSPTSGKASAVASRWRRFCAACASVTRLPGERSSLSSSSVAPIATSWPRRPISHRLGCSLMSTSFRASPRRPTRRSASAGCGLRRRSRRRRSTRSSRGRDVDGPVGFRPAALRARTRAPRARGLVRGRRGGARHDRRSRGRDRASSRGG